MTQGTQHLTAETLERYRAHALDPAGLMAARGHALVCPECREHLSRVTDAGAALASLRDSFMDMSDDVEPEHLAYERLSAYVDSQLDEVEREIVESHLAICADCETDARDLLRYQAIAEQSPFQEITAPPATVTLPLTARTSRRHWLTFDWFPSFGSLAPTAATAALVCVLLAAFWAAYRTREQQPVERARVEQAQTDNAPIVTATTATPASSRPATTDKNGASSSQFSQPSQAPLPDVARDPAMTGDPATLDATTRNTTTRDAATSHAATTHSGRGRRGESAENRPATFALIDGERRVTLDGAGNLRGLESLPPDVQRSITTALINGRAATPRALDKLTGSTGVLMSDSTAASEDGGSVGGGVSGVPFALVTPVGKVVRTAQPTFSWRPLNGASGYTVAVVDAKFNVVEQSERLTTTVWTPSKPLARGATYSWQVTALREGAEVVSPSAPAPQAKFKVLEQDLADELARVEEAHTGSPLVRGVLYARAGLLDEARREFQDLAKANPRSHVARKLLRSVRRR